MDRNEALAFINSLTEIVNQNHYESLTVKISEISVEIKAKNPPPPPPPSFPPQQLDIRQSVVAVPQTESAEKPAGRLVKSPIIGTFYSSPAPDKPAFVSVGDTVKKGDVVCIVESMKLMNEIAAEIDGVVEEVLVDDGAPVEFEQPLFRLS